MEFTEGVRFDSLHLSPEIIRAIEKRNIEVSTPVQAGCIPPMMDWQDVIAKAPTGTGKTFAYGIPIVEHVDPEDESVQAVILAPTRELAIQITDEIRDLAAFKPGVRTVCLYGGAPIGRQIDTLKKHPQIVVATPGRLSDHMKRRTVRVDTAQTVVLDEADRMLDMGFIHDVKKILKWLPAKKQTMLFSATMPPEIAALVNSLLHDPARVAVDPVSSPVEAIQQSVYFVDKGNKTKLLALLIGQLDVKNALVFTRTKHGANKVARDLSKEGITAAAIHGNKSQTARQQALSDFKAGRIRCLVATDIAARGLDIEELSHVFNYNLPDVPETYVHRIGRTGRAGRGGTAISFCDINEKDELKAIEKLIGRAIPVVEGHPWPMEVLEPLPRDKKGRVVNPEDAEARAAAKERRRQRDAANKAAAEARKAKANQKVLEQPPQPEPAGETSAKKRRKRGQRNSATLEEALTATAPARPVQAEFADFHKPDPLASDVIMDATARLLAPRGRAQAVPKKDKPVEQPAKKRKKAARPPEPPAKPEPQAARKRKGSGRHGGRGRPPEVTLRTNGQKDSTEQPSLMKPYYLSHD